MSEKPSKLPRIAIAAVIAVLILPIILPVGKISIRLSDAIVNTALPDISGKPTLPLLSTGGSGAAVVIFISVDCPIANAYAPEIARIARDYSDKNVHVTLVHVDPSLTDEEAARHAAEYALDQDTTIVVDREHLIVEAISATITPEVAVVSTGRNLVYRGRINDLYADLGDKRAAASEHNLRDALDAHLSNNPIPEPTGKPVGCSIEPLD